MATPQQRRHLNAPRLFYLTKRGTTPGPGGLTDETMLESWAGFWASVLDGDS